MKKSLRFPVLALALALPLGAQAGDLSYSYVEAGWATTELDVGDGFDSVDFDGWLLRGSVALGDTFFLAGEYASQTNDDAGVDIDLDQYNLGLGAHYALSDNADLVGQISWVKAEVSAAGFGSVSDDGYGLSVGVRGRLGEQFEGEVALKYADFSDGGDSTAGFLAGRWYFTEAFAVGVNAQFDEDTTSYGIGLRYEFK